jgi:hypothetical protein
MKNKNILLSFLMILFFSSHIYATPVTGTFTVTADVPYTYNIACAGNDTCNNASVAFPSLTQSVLTQGLNRVWSATIYTDDSANGVSFSLVPTGGTFAMSAPGVSTTIPYTVSYTNCIDGTTAVAPNTYQTLTGAESSTVAPSGGGSAPCANYTSTATPDTQELGRGNFTFTIAPYTSNFPEPDQNYTQAITVDVCDGSTTPC